MAESHTVRLPYAMYSLSEKNTLPPYFLVLPQNIKITSTGYKVEIVFDNLKGEITLFKCYGCIAALGGCKHKLALLGWIHRRFEDKLQQKKNAIGKNQICLPHNTLKTILAGVDDRQKLL